MDEGSVDTSLQTTEIITLTRPSGTAMSDDLGEIGEMDPTTLQMDAICKTLHLVEAT